MRGPVLGRVVARLRKPRCPECGCRVSGVECDTCGYQLLLETRDKLIARGPMG